MELNHPDMSNGIPALHTGCFDALARSLASEKVTVRRTLRARITRTDCQHISKFHSADMAQVAKNASMAWSMVTIQAQRIAELEAHNKHDPSLYQFPLGG